MVMSAQHRELMWSHKLRARKENPNWAHITPAKRRILRHLVDHGDVRFWPKAVLKSPGPYKLLLAVGFVEDVYDAERFVVSRITADGRAALAAAAPKQRNRKKT